MTKPKIQESQRVTLLLVDNGDVDMVLCGCNKRMNGIKVLSEMRQGIDFSALSRVPDGII